jgi:Peptidase A4 family
MPPCGPISFASRLHRGPPPAQPASKVKGGNTIREPAASRAILSVIVAALFVALSSPPTVPIQSARANPRPLPLGWASTNWSGYAIPGTVSSVAGRWTVPRVVPNKAPSYLSAWVGIDGFVNGSLIQVGSESDFVGGSARYYAWWEILPATQERIPMLSVRPGDVLVGSVEHVKDSIWQIRLTNVTTHASFSLQHAYGGPGASAEWIVEAPSAGGHVTVLSHYVGQVRFDLASTNGAGADLLATDRGVMLAEVRRVSTPSLPDSDRDGFTISYGQAIPPSPRS